MKTKAVRLYGANDMRLEEFDLPEMKDTEILDMAGAAAILSLSAPDATSGMCEMEKALEFCSTMGRTQL